MKAKCLIITGLFALLAGPGLFPAAVYASTQSQFTINSTNAVINGSPLEMDVAPYIKNNRTFMPIRYVAQALGISNDHIHWEPSSQTVNLMDDANVVQVQVGSTTLMVGGGQSLMDTAPEITNGRTCLPIAPIARAFGYDACWDDSTKTLTIVAE